MPMTPEQALDLLDRAAGQARLTRDEHVAVMAAERLLRPIIAPPAGDEADGPNLRVAPPAADDEAPATPN